MLTLMSTGNEFEGYHDEAAGETRIGITYANLCSTVGPGAFAEMFVYSEIHNLGPSRHETIPTQAHGAGICGGRQNTCMVMVRFRLTRVDHPPAPLHHCAALTSVTLHLAAPTCFRGVKAQPLVADGPRWTHPLFHRGCTCLGFSGAV